MSNSKSAIQEIKKLMVQFGFLTADKELLSFKTTDETIFQTEKLEAGFDIFNINDAYELSNVADGVYKLKENFEIEVKDSKIVAVKEIFLDAKLVDGTQIKVDGDSLVEGAKVVVVTADAEIPAPDGVHELEDGTKVETKDGVILSVSEVAPEAEVEKPEIEVELPLPTDASSPSMDMEMVDMLKEFIKKMGEKMSQMEQSYSSLENEFKAFKKEPAAKKIADGKTEFNKQTNDDMDAKIATILSLRNKK
jgi:hypothetical protein